MLNRIIEGLKGYLRKVERVIPAISPSSYKQGTVRITQGWPEYMNGKKHSGIDMACRKGDKILAVEEGEIVEIVPGSGKRVGRVVQRGATSNMRIIYKHTKAKCKVGDYLSPGDLIGYPDDSGKDVGLWDGYHLHFQIVNIAGDNADPVEYLMVYQPNIVFEFSEYYKTRSYYEKKDYYDKMNLGVPG